MGKNSVMFVQSNEWCSHETHWFRSRFFFFLVFFPFRTAIFSYIHIHTRTVFYVFFSLKNSAYYLRHTKLARRNTATIYEYAMQLAVCVRMGNGRRMFTRLLVSIRCIMNNNIQAQKCLVCFRYGQSECLNTHTETHTKKKHKHTKFCDHSTVFNAEHFKIHTSTC